MSKDIRKETSKQRNRMPFIILLIVLVIVLGVVIFFAVKGKENTKQISGDTTQNEDTGNVEKWQEGIISHDGKNYIYNKDIKVYLLMGIDSDKPAEPQKDHTKGGQSDAMFLLVTDAKEKSISVTPL